MFLLRVAFDDILVIQVLVAGVPRVQWQAQRGGGKGGISTAVVAEGSECRLGRDREVAAGLEDTRSQILHTGRDGGAYMTGAARDALWLK